MSMVDEEPTVEFEAEPVDASPSLASRMQGRADELERQQTEWFPVPGYEDIVEVELKTLGWKTMSSIQHRNERVRDPSTQELYNMADQLLRATVGFREVFPDGSTQPITDDWVRLAKRNSRCPDNPTPRQALLFLVGEKRIMFLMQDFAQWSREARRDVNEEVGSDFTRTG